MGYLEDRAAEGQRQAFEAAKKAEMAKVMSQTPAVPVEGLAAKLGYSDGSLEDAYRAQVAQKVADQNAVAKMIADNQVYNAARKRIDEAPYGANTTDGAVLVQKYRDTIDPGLAAKWMADRGAFK